MTIKEVVENHFCTGCGVCVSEDNDLLPENSARLN